MQVRFNLKDRSKDSTLIYLIFNHIRPRLKYSTKQKIDPKFWDDGKMRVKATRQFKQYPEFNAYLDKLENTVLDTYRRMVNDGDKPTTDAIRAALDLVTFKGKIMQDDQVIPYAWNMYENRQKNPKYKPNTLKVYKSTIYLLEQFEQAQRKKLYFEGMSLDVLFDVMDFMVSTSKLSANTVHKYVKTIKSIFRSALEDCVDVNRAFESRRFTVPKVPTMAVYLSMEQLMHLYSMDLSGNARLDRVRDIALIQSFTGVDYTTFQEISPENTIEQDGTKIFVFIREKTRKKVHVPVHPIVQNILNKRDGMPPKTISNQKLNQYLKELCQIAGFDEPVNWFEYRGNQRIVKPRPFYELVQSHTPRRSFATNAYLSGMPIKMISEMLGHSKVTQTESYIKATGVQTAIVASQTPFFKGEGLMRRV